MKQVYIFIACVWVVTIAWAIWDIRREPKIQEVHFSQWVDVETAGWHHIRLTIEKNGDVYIGLDGERLEDTWRATVTNFWFNNHFQDLR